MGEPLRVDPPALSGAGSAVAGLSEGLTAAVGALTGSYNANAGQDAAGTAFGFAYQDSASALVEAVGKGVNALRHIGYLIQGSATNYSRAEAAADIGGRAAPLPAPIAPPVYSAPGGDPDVNGPGQTPPVLWYLVEFLVGDWWPNGEPTELRAAAAAWAVFATPLYGVSAANSGAYATIGAQQMPDKEPMQQAVRDVGTAMSSLAGEAQKLSNQLSSFATDVETTQNAIRDLLNKLKDVVGSVIDQGIMGTVFELITGDAEEKIQEVADDVKAVIANHKRQSAARKELLAQLNNSIKNYTRAMEIVTRVELVNYLGEDAGRVAANINDAFTDATTGASLSAINTVGGLVTAFDPLGDPKGTWKNIENLSKMALTFNPMTAPTAFAMDPEGSIDMVKNVTHFDDIFTSNRPFLGLGEAGFDIATAVVPGGAGIKAAGGARAAEGAAARAEVSATERAAGEAGGIASATGGLRSAASDVDRVTAKLDDLNKTGLDGGKPPSGSPGPLPKPSEPGPPTAPRDPAPAPTGGKPTSAPPSGDPVSPPVTHTPDPHTPDVAPAPKAEVPSAPAASEAAPTPASSGGVSPSPSAPSGGHPPAPPMDATSGSPAGAAPHGGGGTIGDAPHDGGLPHNGDGHGSPSTEHQPNNPPHTGLHDPPANHGTPGGHLPDLAEINQEYRMPSGAVDPARFDEWTEKVSDEYEPISPAGVGGVYDYSTELHQGMNPYLRDMDSLSERQQSVLGVDSLSDLTPEQRALWEERIAHTDEGLAALPPYRVDPSELASTTWRGMRASDSLLAQLHEGAIFHDPGYLSTTTDSFVAESFARGALPGETPTLLKVVGSDGVDVSQLSRYMDESEILFPRGSQFEILSRELGDDGVLQITMRQVK
ncbi:ADP-ribosyltransferase [Mycobacterium sp. SA01]|uniref:ADP-ribosyltransferase n=1 Tax=Mycobacterium sp. SA01 TaxID=3238820 RepID=UPI00351B9A0E